LSLITRMSANEMYILLINVIFIIILFVFVLIKGYILPVNILLNSLTLCKKTDLPFKKGYILNSITEVLRF
jgi:hypothetical protein